MAKAITALILIPLLLGAGAGFSVSKHYCLGMLKSQSFFGEAQKCAMAGHTNTCSFYDTTIDFDCCEDEQCAIPGISVVRAQQKNNTKDFWSISLDSSPIVSSTKPLSLVPTQITPLNYPLPPPKSRLVLWQRFLI